MATELIALRLSEELRLSVRERAEEEGVSVSEIIRRAVELYVMAVPESRRAAIRGERKRAIAESLMRELAPIVVEIVEKVERRRPTEQERARLLAMAEQHSPRSTAERLMRDPTLGGKYTREEVKQRQERAKQKQERVKVRVRKS